jgi:O-methyltransferase
MLARAGYFRLRTYLASHGMAVPDAALYQPLYSPWLGEAEFECVYAPASELTLVSRDRCFVLYKTLLQALSIDGAIVECGVYRGGTALLAARVLAGRRATRELHLFDSFEGMPPDTDDSERFRPGDLDEATEAGVRQAVAPYPFARIHPGFIPATFEGLELPSIAWAHVDVDLYQSVRDAIEFIYPRLSAGGFLLFDDYGFPSCAASRRAVDAYFADKPEVPLCLPTGQCLVVRVPPRREDG